MDKEIFGNIEIKKIYPVGNCLFYIIGKTLTNKNAGDIDTIKEFENELDKDGINCIKIYTNEIISYKKTILFCLTIKKNIISQRDIYLKIKRGEFENVTKYVSSTKQNIRRY